MAKERRELTENKRYERAKSGARGQGLTERLSVQRTIITTDVVTPLKEELRLARYTILSFASEEYADLLRSFRTYTPPDRGLADWYDWQRDVAKQIIERVETTAPGERAPCPLCGQGVQNLIHQWHGVSAGYTIEGLERHLRGTHQSQQCRVMAAAVALAKEHFAIRELKEGK